MCQAQCLIQGTQEWNMSYGLVEVTDMNQMITQLYLCKLGSLLRISELGEEYIFVAFRNPMGAGRSKMDSESDKGSIFLLLFQFPGSGMDACPNFRGYNFTTEVSFYQLVFKTPSGQISLGSSRSDY